MANRSGFKYPVSYADDQRLQGFCSDLSLNPALFLKKVAAAFVQSVLDCNDNPKEKVQLLRHAMWIEKDNISCLYHARHPLVGNEFKHHVLDALAHFENTGEFLSSEGESV